MGPELIIAGIAGVVAVAILIFGVVSLRSDRQSDVEERLVPVYLRIQQPAGAV